MSSLSSLLMPTECCMITHAGIPLL